MAHQRAKATLTYQTLHAEQRKYAIANVKVTANPRIKVSRPCFFLAFVHVTIRDMQQEKRFVERITHKFKMLLCSRDVI